MSPQPCRDCARGCAARGPRSYCGVDRPGRIYWRGVTLLEEHEIAPTYEVYFTGCSLRCRFCTVPEAIYAPQQGEWLPADQLAEAIAAPGAPPFRTISLVGGDPTVNLPYIRDLLPRLRERLPGVPVVLNTNLFIDPALAAWCAEAFDWIVGDVHFWSASCARAVAGAAGYPAAAAAAAEAALQVGGRVILRILALPGHLDCCAAPTAAWAAGLSGDVRVHMMTHYAPAGRARGHATLGRRLTAEEAQRAAGMLPESVRRPRRGPLPWAGGPGGGDPPVPVEIDAEGRVLVPFVTGSLLPMLAELEPNWAKRLSYLEKKKER